MHSGKKIVSNELYRAYINARQNLSRPAIGALGLARHSLHFNKRHGL